MPISGGAPRRYVYRVWRFVNFIIFDIENFDAPPRDNVVRTKYLSDKSVGRFLPFNDIPQVADYAIIQNHYTTIQ